jgi:hypothetical protein
MPDNLSSLDQYYRPLIEHIIELGRTVEDGVEHDKVKLGRLYLDRVSQLPSRGEVCKIARKLDEPNLRALIKGVTRAEMRAIEISDKSVGIKEEDRNRGILHRLHFRFHIFRYEQFYRNTLRFSAYLRLHYSRKWRTPPGERLLLYLLEKFYYKCPVQLVFANLLWGHGSVTWVPPLLDIYAERFGLDCADELAAWCKKNAENPYVPFNAQFSNAVTYRQRLMEIENYKVRDAEELVWNKLNALRKKKQRREEVKQNDIVRAQSWQEANAKRQQFLKTLSQHSPKERLKLIAESDVALEAIPKYFVVATSELIRDLDEETRDLLLLRLDRRHSGRWKKLKRLLHDEIIST